MAVFDHAISNYVVRYGAETIISFICGFFLNFKSCWGYVNGSAQVVVSNLADFLLSPSFFCEEVVGVCKQKTYKKLDEKEYINRVLSDKPDYI